MWNYTLEEWQKEVMSSLKTDVLPLLTKTIFSGESISAVSLGSSPAPFQALDNSSSFLAIQNYEDMNREGMREWMSHPDVGFRFRQLDDIVIDSDYSKKTFFLSQPFPFVPNEKQTELLQKLSQQNHSLNLGWSPLSFGLTRGEILKKPFYNWESIFTAESLKQPSLKWFYLSSAPYQWAGAEPNVELGVLLSLAWSVLRELEAVGVKLEEAYSRFDFGLALGTDLLVETSKVAAMKLLWKKVGEVLLGVESMSSLQSNACVYALPSLRHISAREPLNNLLRISLMCLSAVIGGAAGFKCVPYDVLGKKKSAQSLRITTNVPLLLKHEGEVALVENVLDGAPLFEQTTLKICEKAWVFFQEIEKKGGIFEAVRSGWLQMELKRYDEIAHHEMSYLQKQLVGINQFVSLHTQSSVSSPKDVLRLRDIIDPLFLTKSPDDYLSVEPLIVNSMAYDWDLVQLRSDFYAQVKGHRPQIKIIKGSGPVVEKKLSWLKHICGLAAMETSVVSIEEMNNVDAATPLVVLIPSQEEMEESCATTLRSKITGKIWSINSHKENTKIDKFIQMNGNVLLQIQEIQALVAEEI